MKNNPHQNLGIEKNTPANEVAGVLQAYLFATHQAVAGTSRVLFPVVEQEMRRLAAQEYVSKPANPAPEVAAPVAAPSNTNVLGQAALQEQLAGTAEQSPELITSDPDDPAVIAAQTRQTIDDLYAEVQKDREEGRMHPEDYNRAA